MEYPLSIAGVPDADHRGGDRRTPVTCVIAEAELGPFAEFGSPDVFFGKLVDISEADVLRLKHAPGVIFRGSGYRFEELGKTGAFKLVRGA